jgi:hypothetical protein
MSIAENIAALRNTIPRHVTIIAVSKTMSTANIMQAYEAGQKIFGENRVQELIRKKQELPEDIDWHLIGHLDTFYFLFVFCFVRVLD